MPGSNDHNWAWPATGGPAESYSTTTHSSTYSGFNWAFDDISGDCQPPEDVLVDTGTFYRMKFEKSGYDTVFRYLLHNAYDESCQQFDCAQNKWVSGGSCKSFEEVEMHPTTGPALNRLPDIFVDPRELEEHVFQCVKMPSVYTPTSNKIKRVGLRVSVGTANVGTGKFHLSQLNPTTVVQKVTRSDESETTLGLGNVDFLFHSSHNHFHIRDWAVLRLLEPAATCASPPGVRPSWCDIAEGEKISFCAINSDSFDNELAALYPDGTLYNCNDPTRQGISPGKKDTYGYGLVGQAIVLGSPESSMPTPGTYRIEAEWDPEGNFDVANELEKSNNRAQITIQIPTFTTSDSLQHNPNCVDPILDCRQGFNQNGHCKDYLRCNTNADCTDGLTCQLNPNDAEEKFCQI